MLLCLFRQRIFENPARIFRKLCPYPVTRRPVIGKLRVGNWKRVSYDNLKGIGKDRIQAIPCNSLIGFMLIKKKKPVHVEIADVVGQLAPVRKAGVGIDAAHELVVRIRIIERVFIHAAAAQDFFECGS